MNPIERIKELKKEAKHQKLLIDQESKLLGWGEALESVQELIKEKRKRNLPLKLLEIEEEISKWQKELEK